MSRSESAAPLRDGEYNDAAGAKGYIERPSSGSAEGRVTPSPSGEVAANVRRPRLLDLFCGAGGAAMGYHRAGFEVVGVDIAPQPDYPFEFNHEDAMRWLEKWAEWELGSCFDAIHASPPCQRYTAMKAMWNHKGDAHPDLVCPTRALLETTGLPWVMENVPGAPMEHSIMLCGTMFGLGSGGYELRRHRLFETSFPILGPTCQHTDKPTLGIYGDHARDRRRVPGSENRHRGRQLANAEALPLAREAMEMPWVSKWRGVSEAIPPAYTEFIGAELLRQMSKLEVAA